jgi:hypothetical protein
VAADVRAKLICEDQSMMRRSGWEINLVLHYVLNLYDGPSQVILLPPRPSVLTVKTIGMF